MMRNKPSGSEDKRFLEWKAENDKFIGEISENQKAFNRYLGGK